MQENIISRFVNQKYGRGKLSHEFIHFQFEARQGRIVH
jgi:hypothetical protein